MREIPDLEIQRPSETTAVVVLSGDHDIAHAEELDQLLATLVAENEVVVVDLSAAQFIDSSVINALVRAKNAATGARRAFRVQVGTQAIVQRALAVSGVLEFLEAVATREEALAPPEALQ
jgi:anti-sigma B factor antagonist